MIGLWGASLDRVPIAVRRGRARRRPWRRVGSGRTEVPRTRCVRCRRRTDAWKAAWRKTSRPKGGLPQSAPPALPVGVFPLRNGLSQSQHPSQTRLDVTSLAAGYRQQLGRMPVAPDDVVLALLIAATKPPRLFGNQGSKIGCHRLMSWGFASYPRTASTAASAATIATCSVMACYVSSGVIPVGNTARRWGRRGTPRTWLERSWRQTAHTRPLPEFERAMCHEESVYVYVPLVEDTRAQDFLGAASRQGFARRAPSGAHRQAPAQ